jgi:hypothetical protein
MRLHLPFASPEGEGLEPRRGQLKTITFDINALSCPGAQGCAIAGTLVHIAADNTARYFLRKAFRAARLGRLVVRCTDDRRPNLALP